MTMPSEGSCVSLPSYLKVHIGKIKKFKGVCVKLVQQTSEEAHCLYYGFTFNDDEAHCREDYEGAKGILAHLENVDHLLKQALQIADPLTLEIHGTKDELAKLHELLAALSLA